MRTVRRALLAIGATAVATAIIRLRGSGGTPPRHGGWRELTDAELNSTAPAPTADSGTSGSS